MKQRILNHTSVMIILTVILTFVAASFIMYDKFNATMKTGVRDEAEYVKVGLEEAGETYLNDKVGNATDTRITLTDEKGNVLYDSEADATRLPNLFRQWKMDRGRVSAIQRHLPSRLFIMQ